MLTRSKASLQRKSALPEGRDEMSPGNSNININEPPTTDNRHASPEQTDQLQGLNMTQLQNIINEMVNNAFKNYIPSLISQTTGSTTNQTTTHQPTLHGSTTTIRDTSDEASTNISPSRHIPVTNSNERLTTVIMPEKFTSKDCFTKWRIKFESYCRMNRIMEEDKLDSLILLLDNTVLYEIYDNPMICSDYNKLTTFLSENFKGGITEQAAYDELELLVAKRAHKPDDLDHIAQRIDSLVDTKFPTDTRERKTKEKILYLSKVLPSAIQNNFYCSNKNTLDEGVAVAKKLWHCEIKAERDRNKGISLINDQYQRKQNTGKIYAPNSNKTKWCPYHKTNTHSKEACLKLKERQRNQANNAEAPPQLNNQNNNITNNESGLINNETIKHQDDQLKELLPSKPLNLSFRESLRKLNEKDNLIGAVVKINGILLIALIDTGSNCIILNKNLKEKLNLEIDREAPITTYQSSTMACYVSNPITIQVQNKTFTLNENIFISKEPFSNTSYDAIIGTNVLRKLLAVIDLQTGKIIMKEDVDEKDTHNKIQSNMVLSGLDENIDTNQFIMILKEKYPDAYAKHSYDIGPGKIVSQPIEIFKDKDMIKAPYYTIPIHEREEVSKILNTWIENGLLEKSTSNILHPIMLLNKPNCDKNSADSKRFIADLRQVNSITKPVNYNTPKVQDLLHSLQAFNFITKIDLKSAFFQIRIPEESRGLYGIRTPIGNLQFTRLPQGGKVSSALFQRAMEETFRPINKNCLIYCDDILLFSKGTIKEHEQLINQFMSIANKYQLKVSLEKSIFFATKAKFLGFEVSATGTKPDPSNVSNILNRTIPKRKKHCISFLQALNYFRHVIPDFSRIAKPLYEVSKGKDGEIKLNEEQLNSYHTLRQKIMNAPIMFHPIHGIPFILTTDASNEGIGAILSQEQEAGEVPLSFYSAKLTSTKRSRSTTYLELYAIAKALQHFKFLLSSAKIIIKTDHKPLLHLTSSNCEKKYRELLESIEEYDTTYEYIAGKTNQVADWLSRLPITQEQCNTIMVQNPVKRKRGRPPLKRKKLQEISQDEKVLQNIKKKTNVYKQEDKGNKNTEQEIPKRKRGRPRKHKTDENNMESTETKTDSTTEEDKENPIDSQELDASTELSIKADLHKVDLLKLQKHDKKCQEALETGKYDHHEIVQDQNGLIKVKISGEEIQELIIIPEEAIKSIFALAHDFNGHFGYTKTKAAINKSCYISMLSTKLAKYLSECEICKRRNAIKKINGPIKTVLPAPVMEQLSMDILGPISTRGSRQQKYILNIIDTGSRYVFPMAIKTIQHEEIMDNLMNNVFLRYGFPKSLRCDNAQNFKANSLKELLQKLNIEFIYTTPYYSQSNSICERYLRTLQAGIHKLISMTGKEWDTYLPFLAHVYNANIIDSFQKSPFELMFSRMPTNTLDLFLRTFNIALHDRDITIFELMEKAQITRDIANENHLQTRLHINDKMQQRPYYTYKKGDKVFVRNKTRHGKFENIFDGPFEIIEDMESKVKYKNNKGKIKIASKTNVKV
uniref:RNA-directed DNA polymerase n=1 Tax=Parastrongyloides trichosuri TaxID=131310 RepID=A0A0N4Z6B3_PARTI